MDIHNRFRRAIDEFDRRVQAVDDDQWQGPTPCTEWNVRDLVNHVVSEARWLPPILEGKTMEEVGDRFEGDLLGEDPKGAWEDAASQAVEAVNAPGVLEGSVHLSYGEKPAKHYLTELTADITVHSWDLARAVGADEQLDEELVELAYATFGPQVEEWRAAGVFAAAVEVPAEAERQTQLLALLGRRV
ncbi:MAG: TIGR03086 family metal-binding protein [Actinomycetota bacterium]|nr:TIGR03086 family metal-binding protein [Actinomycetota bacterium]